jgi:hypothetical protein
VLSNRVGKGVECFFFVLAHAAWWQPSCCDAMHSMAVVHPAYVLIVWALLLLLVLVCVEATPEGATMWAQLKLGASAAALHSSTVAGVVHCVATGR